MKLSHLVFFYSLLLLILPSLTNAQTPTTKSVLNELQHGWAIANYELPDKQQIQALETLIEKGEMWLNTHPNDAEVMVWTGIVTSSLAGAKGGLGALGLAKLAKSHLERAIEINPSVLNGSAYTSLGVLYNNVPSWPIGFGDKKKANKNLSLALKINPTGIDANYFYANYLIKKKKYIQAKLYLDIALQASPRPNRTLADAGRRKEIQQALDKIQKRL